MCGIAGIIKWGRGEDGPRPGDGGAGDAALANMSAAIAHRGPDGAGMFVDPRPGAMAGLVHRRLAIIDKPCGAQPMCNENATVWVVFNGEIYNHVALRTELREKGHLFASDHSDTEVLVHGWEEWGTELPARLVGMFAFAIWDQGRGAPGAHHGSTLFLARDRMGQKPLFYASLEDGIAFGSTIASVLAWPEVPRRIPREQIATYLLLGYFPGPQTIYRDISQVMPGAWVRLRGEVLDGNLYWKNARQMGTAQPGATAELRDTLARAVESQLVADVPIACFLSGGIDSSIIAALMQKAVLAAGGNPIQTVSAGFAEDGFDETAYAALVAKQIKSRHTRLQVTGGREIMATLRMLMATSLGQPFADSSILPTWHLSRAVRSIAPVALSGDGADELFGGYDRYRAAVMLERWRSLARLLPKSTPVGSLHKQERYRRLAAAARTVGPSERYTRLMEIFPIPLVEELLDDAILDWAPPPEELGLEEHPSALRLAMVRDQKEYLPGDVLWKVDSASMSAGPGAAALEVRSPFLDHRVVEWASGLAESDLIRGGLGKRALREAFRSELPTEILGRGKKGFAAPLGEWFKGPLREDLAEALFSQGSFTRTHLKPDVAARLVEEHARGARDHTHRLFSLLMLELWWQQSAATLED